MGGTRVNVLVDQLGHWLWAFAVVWIAMRFPGAWWAGAFAALLLCLPRELVDQWPVNNWFDTVIDIFFFMVAGLVAALLI